MAATALTLTPVLPFSQPSSEKKPSPVSIAADHSLMEIDGELDELFDRMQEELEETGLASAENIARFHQYCEAFGEKVDRIGRFIRIMEARVGYCKSEAARLSARARTAENKMDHTKALVLYYLATREISKMEGKAFTLRCQKNSQDSVRIDNAAAIPFHLKRVEARFDGTTWERLLAALPADLKPVLLSGIQETTPVNDAIKQAVGRNETVDGATVSRGHHLRVA